MRILYVSPRQNWPTNSGAKLRDYHLLRSLESWAKVTFVGFCEDADNASLKEALTCCDQVILLPRPRAYTPAAIVKGLVTDTPLPVLNYASASLAQELRTQLEVQPFDLLHLESTHLGWYANSLRDLRALPQVVYDWHNVESELLERYAEANSGLRAWYAGLTSIKMSRYEESLLATHAGHVVCSDRERTGLLDKAPNARVATIENGVDTKYFNVCPAQTSNRLVYVGSMNYHANVEAAVYFTEQCWPVVSEKFPELILTLVGASPTDAVKRLARHPRVEVTGTVPDIRPYYAEAFAAIVPLRVGGGTRLKILEAMAAGVPVISTAVGREGLAAQPSVDLLEAETPADWVTALQEVSQPQRRNALVRSGRSLVEQRYDWAILGRQLRAFYEGLVEARA